LIWGGAFRFSDAVAPANRSSPGAPRNLRLFPPARASYVHPITMLATRPLAIDRGDGSELRRPLGLPS
jgi:hypothetical protein